MSLFPKRLKHAHKAGSSPLSEVAGGSGSLSLSFSSGALFHANNPLKGQSGIDTKTLKQPPLHIHPRLSISPPA